jgi:hypothetical protein
VPKLRNLLEDKRDISNTAVAPLVSIAVLMIYLGILKEPGGPENLFYLLYLFLKAIGAVDESFGKFVGFAQDTPVWPLLAQIGSQAGMVILVAATFSGTWWTVSIISKVLVWRRAMRGGRQKAPEKDGEGHRRWRESLDGIDEEEPSGLLPRLASAYRKPKKNDSDRAKGAKAKEDP